MPAAKASGNKDENNNNNSSSSSGRKSSSAAARQGGQEQQQQQQALKCPRCDSQNTKFCYYNNYSLTQPRHFCKTCRRYWTKGGALRNVPIGGGCRKNKKMMKSSSSSSSRLSLGGDSKDSSCSTSSDIGGLKFFHGLTPAMDFQLGTGLISFPRVLHHHQSYNQFPSFGDISSSTTSAANTSGFTALDPSLSTTPLLGFNFPFSSPGFNNNNGGGVQEMGCNNNNIASSIESLSSINQDLHWKLQQQRLAAMFCGSEIKDHNNNVVPASSSSFGLDHHNHTHEKPQTILFHNLEETSKDHQQEEELYSRKEGETEWFFGDSYNNNNNNGASAAVTTSSTPMINNSNWMNNGMQSWSNLNNQYTSLP